MTEVIRDRVWRGPEQVTVPTSKFSPRMMWMSRDGGWVWCLESAYHELKELLSALERKNS